MPTISGRTSVGIGVTVQNLLLGSQYELAPFDATIEVGMMADKNLVTCAIFAGPDVLAEPGSFVPFAAAEAAPKYPDDFHWEDTVAHGDRLKITISNGNAAITLLNWSIRITPA
jgi:hypothetical protein